MRSLGIDVGSTTTKVVLTEVIDDRVVELSLRVGETPRDAPALLALVARMCREVIGDDPAQVAAVGIASMAETGVPIDADGNALTELLRWDAGHGAAEASRMSSLAPEVFAATGVRISAKTPLATWAWLRREHPEVCAAMVHWLGAADLVAHALTGRAVTDHTLAGRTGGYRLPVPGEPLATGFDTDLLALVGLEPDRLPRVDAPDDVPPVSSPAASDRFGLATGTPVVIAGHDHQVAAWGAGVRAPGDVADSLGTAEAVLTVLPARPDPEQVRTQGMSLVRTIGGDHDGLVSGNAASGGLLAHWLQSIEPELRGPTLEAAARDRDDHPAPTGAPVAPYLRGRQSPEPDPTAQPGTPPSAWPRHRQLRAVTEGICYQSRWMIQSHADLGRRPATVVLIAGSRLPRVWTDTVRDVLPWPVAPSSAAEPVATGAALLAAVRAGLLGPVPDQLANAPVLATPPLPPPAEDPHADAFRTFVGGVGG